MVLKILVILYISPLVFSFPDALLNVMVKAKVNSNDVLDNYIDPSSCPVVSCEQCTTPSTTEEVTPIQPEPTQGTTVNTVLEACSSKGGVVVGQECFIFSEVGEELSWQDAVDSCWQKYGPLASPSNPISLRDYVAGNYNDIPFWVGGYSYPNAKSFRWVNGTEIPSDPQEFPWAPNEPTNPDGDRRCMQVNYGGGYAVQPCSDQERYACNLDACGLLGGVTLGYQCIKVNEDPLNWGAATEACASDGGRLLVPAYPQLHFDYFTKKNNGISESSSYWVGGLQTDYSKEGSKEGNGFFLGDNGNNFWGPELPTDYSKEESWYWLNGQLIPRGDDNFPWADGEPNNDGGNEHCLNLESYNDSPGYNDLNCDLAIKYICELDTSQTQLPSPVKFVITQIASGKYIGPENVFPKIQDNDNLRLHFILDRNMHMTFDIVEGIWGYIRHVISGKILTPFDDGTDTAPMNPKDGTRVVLRSDRRPWAFFALDQYQNRIVHRSGKYISSHKKYITITSDANETMEFQFMNPNNPDVEILPYGYPVISGDWQLVFSVVNPISTHTYSAKLTVGRSESLSSSYGFKYGFEVAKNKRISSSTSSSSYAYSSSYNSKSDSGSSSSCKTVFIFFSHCSSNSGDGSSSGNSQGSGSGSSSSSSSSSGTTTTNSMSSEMQQASSDTWSSSMERDISFTVEAGKSVTVWQRRIIFEHRGHKAVHLSNIFADTDSSRINPNNFGTLQRRFH